MCLRRQYTARVFHLQGLLSEMEELSFKLETFEGPLDLLLSLISKNKVNIYDIPISLILEQYLEYLEKMRKMDMDIAGEFIVTASELMLIKSRMMLPKSVLDDEEEDPRARLASALIEYKRAKEAAKLLSENYGAFAGRYAKKTDEKPYESIPVLTDQDPLLLEKAFIRIFERSRKLKSMLNTPNSLQNLLNHRVTPIPERIIGIMRYLYKKGNASFEEILLQGETRSDVIASFGALLELLKVRRLFIDVASPQDNPVFTMVTEGRRRDAGRK